MPCACRQKKWILEFKNDQQNKKIKPCTQRNALETIAQRVARRNQSIDTKGGGCVMWARY